MRVKNEKNIKNEFTAIDLFSGCGGLSSGLKRAGFSVRVAVELDPIAVKAYRKNHPETHVIKSDIHKISAGELKKTARLGHQTLDLLVGCPPCQGFSRIRRGGKRDRRNDLIFDFLRIAKAFRPKMILLENVPGLEKNYRFNKLTKYLKADGYWCSWAVLNAADFGVPQRRKRLIMMASRLGPIELPGVAGNRYKTVRGCIGKLKNPEKTRDIMHQMYLKNTLRIRKLIAKIPVDGGSRDALGEKQQLACHKRIQGFRDVYGRMKWDDVAPTLTGGCYNPSKGRFLHPEQDRPISLREAALLQTFPKRYYFPAEAGLTAIARLIGDALPPIFAQRQGEHLMHHLVSAGS